MTADDGGIRADARSTSHTRRAVLLLAFDEGARVVHVRKNAARAQERLVLNLDALVNRHAVLHLDAVPEAHTATDEDVLAEHAAPADPRVARYVDEVPDLGALADLRAVIDDGGRVHLH